MKDLSTLELEIENPKTRALLSEVINCYHAGAHRASLVSLWITVAVDLIHKLRYLADTGDNEVRKHLEGYDTAIRDKTSPELKSSKGHSSRSAKKNLIF